VTRRQRKTIVLDKVR